MKRKFISRNVFLAVALILFIGMGLSSIASTNNKIQLREVQLKDTSAELKQLDLKYKKLNVQLDTVDKTKTEEIKKLETEKQRLESEKKELEKQVQAKREAQRIAAERASKAVKTASATVAPKVSATTPKATTGGSCASWIAQAGIKDTYHANLLINGESGCNPCIVNGGAINCNYSGPKAYGIPQSLPGNKMASAGADWRTNPVTQLRWMDGYIKGRYGSWANAYATWKSRSPHWY